VSRAPLPRFFLGRISLLHDPDDVAAGILPASNLAARLEAGLLAAKELPPRFMVPMRVRPWMSNLPAPLKTTSVARSTTLYTRPRRAYPLP